MTVKAISAEIDPFIKLCCLSVAFSCQLTILLHFLFLPMAAIPVLKIRCIFQQK